MPSFSFMGQATATVPGVSRETGVGRRLSLIGRPASIERLTTL